MYSAVIYITKFESLTTGHFLAIISLQSSSIHQISHDAQVAIVLKWKQMAIITYLKDNNVLSGFSALIVNISVIKWNLFLFYIRMADSNCFDVRTIQIHGLLIKQLKKVYISNNIVIIITYKY